MMLSRPKLFKLLLLDPMCRQTNRSNGNVDLMWKLQIHHCCLENQLCWHYQHSSPVMSFQAGAWFKSESRNDFRFGSFLMKLLNSLIAECWKCMLIWSKEFVHRELSCSNIISQWTLVARWHLGFWQLTITSAGQERTWFICSSILFIVCWFMLERGESQMISRNFQKCEEKQHLEQNKNICI